MTKKPKNTSREPIPYFRQRAWLAGITFALFMGWAALMYFVPHPVYDVSGETWTLWRGAETTHFGLLVLKSRLLWVGMLGIVLVLLVILCSVAMRRGIVVGAVTGIGALAVIWLMLSVEFVGIAAITVSVLLLLGMVVLALWQTGWQQARWELLVISPMLGSVVGGYLLLTLTQWTVFDVHQTDTISQAEGDYHLLVTNETFALSTTVYHCERENVNCVLLYGSIWSAYPPNNTGIPSVSFSTDTDNERLYLTVEGSDEDETITIERIAP